MTTIEMETEPVIVPPAPPPLADTYALHHRRLCAMLAWLDGELDAHNYRAKATPPTPSVVADLAAAEVMLRRALVCLCGMSELQILRTLLAMRDD